MGRLPRIALPVLVVVLVAVPVVLWKHDRQILQLTPQEKETMEFLPGYSFLFEGERIEIKKRRMHRSFIGQHRMITFLEDVVPILQSIQWTNDRPPIKVTETEYTVEVVIPTWPPPPENSLSWFLTSYFVKIIYDKSTGERIWGRTGG